MRRPDLPSVFVDADVLIAGSASTTGASHLILQLGELGLIDLVTCDQALDEAERNIARKLPGAAEMFRRLARAACRVVPDPGTGEMARHAGAADPKDLPILVAAVTAGCATLVTFNVRDYRPGPSGVVVETPGPFVERLRRQLRKIGEPADRSP